MSDDIDIVLRKRWTGFEIDGWNYRLCEGEEQK